MITYLNSEARDKNFYLGIKTLYCSRSLNTNISALSVSIFDLVIKMILVSNDFHSAVYMVDMPFRSRHREASVLKEPRRSGYGYRRFVSISSSRNFLVQAVNDYWSNYTDAPLPSRDRGSFRSKFRYFPKISHGCLGVSISSLSSFRFKFVPGPLNTILVARFDLEIEKI